MENGEEVEVLDPQVAEIVAKARKAYVGLKALQHEMPYSWEEMRPRLIRRINYDLGISEVE